MTHLPVWAWRTRPACKPLAPLLLPALYVHRNMRGAWKILAGKK